MLKDRKPRLGRGLGALIPDYGDSAEGEIQVSDLQQIPVGSIAPNPYQPRMYFNAERIAELAASIQEHGIAQPVIVRQTGEGYELVAGERRWRAAKLIGMETIPALVREMSDDESLQIALIENLQREDINPVEEARALQQLVKRFNLTQDEVAKKVGKSRPAVTNMIRLLDLPDEILERVMSGAISGGHARTLLSLPVNEQRVALLHKIIEQRLSVRQTEEAVRRMLDVKEAPKKNKVGYIFEKEDFIKSKVWSRFTFQGGQDKGKLIFSYTSEEERQKLLQQLGIA